VGALVIEITVRNTCIFKGYMYVAIDLVLEMSAQCLACQLEAALNRPSAMLTY